MIEVANGLYVPASRIVNMRIFEKEGSVKVRIALDTVNPEERVVYSGAMENKDQAKIFIQNCSNQM